MNKNTKPEGFTLIELTISLLIIGLLIAGILGPLSTRIEQKERQATQEILNDIKESLIGFAITNGRLPCPDTDSPADGIENPLNGAGGCDDVEGSVPYSTLSVVDSDSWSNEFKYRITGTFGDDTDGDGCGTATVGVSFELCSVGNIDIQTLNNVGALVSSVDDVPAVVFSGGKNNFTGSTLEQENTNGDETFIFTDYRQEAGKEYDDLMIWISPNILKYQMVQAGRLP